MNPKATCNIRDTAELRGHSTDEVCRHTRLSDLEITTSALQTTSSIVCLLLSAFEKEAF